MDKKTFVIPLLSHNPSIDGNPCQALLEEDTYGETCLSRHGGDYWHARNMFLASYRFAEHDKGVKDWLRRSVKEMNSAVIRVVVSTHCEIVAKKRRFRVGVYKFRLSFPKTLVKMFHAMVGGQS